MSDAGEHIRFLADENFREQIVAGLRRRQPALDIQTAAESAILRRPDPSVLNYASEHNRLLLSHDVHTLPVHFADLLARGWHSPGVLLVPQTLPIGQAIQELLLVWEASGPEEWRDLCVRLPL